MNANPLFGQRRARDRYNLLVADVTRAINDADPKSLLEFGAPSDEYSPEVGTIVPRVSKAPGPAEVRTILHEEFERWFGLKLAHFLLLSMDDILHIVAGDNEVTAEWIAGVAESQSA